MVTAAPLRIVFFGTPAFAVPTLEALIASRHAVVAVVTQPDRPRGRGQNTSDAPVKASAAAAAVPVLQPVSMKDAGFLGALERFQPDLGVVAAYGQILTAAVLAAPRLGIVNVHASLLPKYRGAAPVHRAIIAGERETGITIMRVVQALDAGPVLAAIRRPIGPDETSEEVERDLAAIGAALAVSTIDRLVDAGIAEVAQNDAEATYARRLAREDGMIDWALPAGRLHDLVRGLHPWPHAFTFLDSRRLILHRSTPLPGESHSPPGSIVDATGDLLCVAAGSGTLKILQIQPEGRRPMTAREFLAGHAIKAGAIFRRP